MRLVIDTNILISALIKDSITREILLQPFFDFLMPEFTLEEISRHKDEIYKRSGLGEYEVDLLLGVILECVEIVPYAEIKSYLKEADEIIGEIDQGDIPFVATVLATNNDGIWSNDKDFDSVGKIKVWKTKDIMKYVSKL